MVTMNEDNKLARSVLNGSRGLRALEAIRVLSAGLDPAEQVVVLKLIETAANEIRQQGKAPP